MFHSSSLSLRLAQNYLFKPGYGSVVQAKGRFSSSLKLGEVDLFQHVLD